MSFSTKIATSLFLAAAVAATPTPQDSITVGLSSASFDRPSFGRGWNSPVTRNGYADLVRRGDDGYYDAPSRSTRRRGARQYDRASRYDSSSGSDNDDDDDDYKGSQRPAFSREVPSVRQLDYEAAVARRRPGYSRLQRRSHDDSDDSDTSSDSDSYDQGYNDSVGSRQSYDDEEYRRLVRRDRQGSRRNRFNDYDTESSSSGEEAYGQDYGYAAAPAHTPYADDYYEGVAGRGARGSQRDRRLVRRDDYGVKKSYGGDSGDDKKKKKGGSSSSESSSSSSSSSSDSDRKKDQGKKESDNDAYKSDDDYQAAEDYKSGNDYQVAGNDQAADNYQAADDDYKRLVRRGYYPNRRQQRRRERRRNDYGSTDRYARRQSNNSNNNDDDY